jgi:hypothetical protein
VELGEHGGRLRDDVVAAWGLNPAEVLVLEHVCREVDLVERIRVELEGSPLVVKGSMGQPAPSPLVERNLVEEARQCVAGIAIPEPRVGVLSRAIAEGSCGVLEELLVGPDAFAAAVVAMPTASSVRPETHLCRTHVRADQVRSRALPSEFRRDSFGQLTPLLLLTGRSSLMILTRCSASMLACWLACANFMNAADELAVQLLHLGRPVPIHQRFHAVLFVAAR